MKTFLKHTLPLMMFAILTVSVQAQGTTTTTQKTTTTTTTKTKTTTKKTKRAPAKATTVPGKEITISVKNTDEKQVPVYAGLKEGLRTPKLKVLGGSSTNNVYVHVNEVVCIMSADGKKAVACQTVKATTKSMEISSSGTEISSK